MTQYPPDPSNPYSGGYAPDYARPGMPRPTSVTVLAIIGIVIASLGLLCNGIGLITALVLPTMASSGVFGAAGDQMKDPPARVFNITDALVSLILWVILMIGCIGALHLKAMARRLVMRWAVAALVFFVLRAVAQAVWIIPINNAYTQRQMQAQGASGAAGAGMLATIGYVSVVVWALVCCVFPICVLIFWKSPTVKRAFETGGLNDDPGAGAFTTPGSFGPPGVGPQT